MSFTLKPNTYKRLQRLHAWASELHETSWKDNAWRSFDEPFEKVYDALTAAVSFNVSLSATEVVQLAGILARGKHALKKCVGSLGWVNKRSEPDEQDLRRDVEQSYGQLSELVDEIGELIGQINSAVEPETPGHQWDVFIAHASEDKESFVRPLAEKLLANDLRVWYDEFTLKVGDSLRRSIDLGLSYSRFGVVVISQSFLAKEWPQRELDGLTAREVGGRKVILPIWHDIDLDSVRRFSPVLADRLAVRSSMGVGHVVEELLQAMRMAGGQV